MCTPSVVRAGPVQVSRAARAARSASTRSPGLLLRYAGVDRPVRRVDEHVGTGREPECTGDAHHAGDAELAGDDRGVAGGAALLGHQGDDHLGVQAGGVGGREVLGHQHGRDVGPGDAGLGLADEPGDDPALDVEQVGGPLGHQPTHGGEDVDELRDTFVHGREQSRIGDPGGHGLPQPGVAGQPGTGGEHLGRRPAGPRGPLGEPAGDRLGRRVVRGHRGVGIGVAAVAVRLDRLGRDLLGDQHDGTVGEARNDRRATQRGGWTGGRRVR